MTNNPTGDQPAQEPTEKKIIIDEDWKSQVQAEKEQAASPQAETAQDTGAKGSSLPPASLAMLITTLATQVLASLGQIADPSGQQPPAQPELAKHFIDTLAVLQEKTKGNLDDEEAHLLDDTLHQLRMLYLSITGSSVDGETDA